MGLSALGRENLTTKLSFAFTALDAKGDGFFDKPRSLAIISVLSFFALCGQRRD